MPEVDLHRMMDKAQAERRREFEDAFSRKIVEAATARHGELTSAKTLPPASATVDLSTLEGCNDALSTEISRLADHRIRLGDIADYLNPSADPSEGRAQGPERVGAIGEFADLIEALSFLINELVEQTGRIDRALR